MNLARRSASYRFVGDSLKQVRLSQTSPPVNEERVEGRAAGLSGHRLACAPSNAIAVPFQEGRKPKIRP